MGARMYIIKEEKGSRGEKNICKYLHWGADMLKKGATFSELWQEGGVEEIITYERVRELQMERDITIEAVLYKYTNEFYINLVDITLRADLRACDLWLTLSFSMYASEMENQNKIKETMRAVSFILAEGIGYTRGLCKLAANDIEKVKTYIGYFITQEFRESPFLPSLTEIDIYKV